MSQTWKTYLGFLINHANNFTFGLFVVFMIYLLLIGPVFQSNNWMTFDNNIIVIKRLKLRTKHYIPLPDNSPPPLLACEYIVIWQASFSHTGSVTYQWPSPQHLAVMSFEESRKKHLGILKHGTAFQRGLNLEFPEQDYAGCAREVEGNWRSGCELTCLAHKTKWWCVFKTSGR